MFSINVIGLVLFSHFLKDLGKYITDNSFSPRSQKKYAQIHLHNYLKMIL